MGKIKEKKKFGRRTFMEGALHTAGGVLLGAGSFGLLRSIGEASAGERVPKITYR